MVAVEREKGLVGLKLNIKPTGFAYGLDMKYQ